MECDLDDPLPFESHFWGFSNRFSEEWIRLARLFGFLVVLVALALPYPAKAQSAGYGIVCDTPDQVRRYVLADDTRSTIAAINAEKAQSCSLMKVSFYVGNVDGTIVTNDGVWKITHILIVGIATHGGIRPMEPTPRWIAIAVASEPA
jgi:hypothetical protein